MGWIYLIFGKPPYYKGLLIRDKVNQSSQNRPKGTPPPVVAVVTNISYDGDGEQSAAVVCKIHQSLLFTSPHFPPFMHYLYFEEIAQQRFFVFQYPTFILLFQETQGEIKYVNSLCSK